MTKAALFDMDGVLVASASAHEASWRAVARQHGIAFTTEQFRETFGRPSRDIIRILWGKELADDELKRIDDAKERLYRELITGLVPLTIGTRECVSALAAAGFALAVATSGPPENVELILRESRLAPFFASVVTGMDIQNGKPAPDCFLLAAQRLRVEPARCVVVEDAPVGVAAAHAANMKCAGLVGTHPRARLQQAGCDLVVDHLRDLTPDALNRLLAQSA